MLARRGLIDDAAIEAYLHPESQELPDPFALSDMDRAAARIRAAIAAGERICVYGDYDTDGVCATAILFDALKRLGANVTFLLPSRQGEGYGLNCGAIQTILSREKAPSAMWHQMCVTHGQPLSLPLM